MTEFEDAIAALLAALADIEVTGDLPQGDVDALCAALVELLRLACPGRLPPDPVPPGTPAVPVPVAADHAGTLIGTAVAQAVATAATGRPPDPAKSPGNVLWRDGIDSLLVRVPEISVALQAGVVQVRLPVACDQLDGGTDTVVVEIHVGTPDRPTGLLAATPERPDGPVVVVDRWGAALTALAWRAVLDAVGGIAAAAGRDTDGTPLVPVALVASPDAVAVLPQARHGFDRVLQGEVVS